MLGHTHPELITYKPFPKDQVHKTTYQNAQKGIKEKTWAACNLELTQLGRDVIISGQGIR